jgi:RNA polymerase sigma factor (sigma-70 family)
MSDKRFSKNNKQKGQMDHIKINHHDSETFLMKNGNDPNTGYLPCIHDNDCDAFVLKYIDFVYYIVMKFKPSVTDDEVEELVHDIFLQLLQNNREKLKLYDPVKGFSLKNWINLIATRFIINYLRRKNRNVVFKASDSNNPDFLEYFENTNHFFPHQNKMLAHIEDLIETLPKRYRLFFELFYHKNMDLSEIADFLKISRDSVYSLKYKASKCLKKKIGRLPKGG